jgi:hypothetical protein
MTATLSSMSCVIPTHERILMNIRNGPGSSTSKDAMRQVANPNTTNSIIVIPATCQVLQRDHWSPTMGRPVSRGTWDCPDYP